MTPAPGPAPDGVLLTRSERVPRRPGPTGLAASAALVAAYVALAVAALLGGTVATAVLVVGCAAAEVVVARTAGLTLWGLDRLGLTLPWRWVLATALVAVVVTDALGAGTGVVVVAAAAVVAAGGALLEGLAQVVEHLRKSPVLSRGLPLDGLAVPPEPRALLHRRARLLWPVVVVLLALAAAAADGSVPDWLAGAAAVSAVLAALAVVGWGALRLQEVRRAQPRKRVPAAVQEAVTALAPDLVLYYGGSAEALYQLEMWLPTFEASSHRTLVVLRDREALRRLRATSLPVVCIPAGTSLVAFDLSSVRGALFVSNAATNIHLIRKGGMRTAFIGHGDSDKASSRSPFTKVYDEIWVAGPAGAERYAGWETAVVRDRIRLVGRPQAVASPRRRAADGPVTVLYAPTWEGWGDEPFHSSLPHLGVALVRRLLDQPHVRVLYRPHPLTGTRDAAVRRAHREVIALLEGAGAQVHRGAVPVATPGDGDDLGLMLAAGAPRAGATAVAAADEEAAAGFWSSAPASTHRVVEGSWPGLASCFDQSDAMVADVSSVVSDWLALDRPLALTNPEGLAPDEFAARVPSSRAGLLVGPDLTGLDALLDDLRSGHDRTGAQRAVEREHLLGTPPEDGARRFAEALDELVRQARAGADQGQGVASGLESGRPTL